MVKTIGGVKLEGRAPPPNQSTTQLKPLAVRKAPQSSWVRAGSPRAGPLGTGPCTRRRLNTRNMHSRSPPFFAGLVRPRHPPQAEPAPDLTSPANRGWGWGWTPDPRQIGDGTPIPIPGQIGDGDGDGDRGFRALIGKELCDKAIEPQFRVLYYDACGEAGLRGEIGHCQQCQGHS